MEAILTLQFKRLSTLGTEYPSSYTQPHRRAHTQRIYESIPQGILMLARMQYLLQTGEASADATAGPLSEAGHTQNYARAHTHRLSPRTHPPTTRTCQSHAHTKCVTHRPSPRAHTGHSPCTRARTTVRPRTHTGHRHWHAAHTRPCPGPMHTRKPKPCAHSPKPHTQAKAMYTHPSRHIQAASGGEQT